MLWVALIVMITLSAVSSILLYARRRRMQELDDAAARAAHGARLAAADARLEARQVSSAAQVEVELRGREVPRLLADEAASEASTLPARGGL